MGIKRVSLHETFCKIKLFSPRHILPEKYEFCVPVSLMLGNISTNERKHFVKQIINPFSAGTDFRRPNLIAAVKE